MLLLVSLVLAGLPLLIIAALIYTNPALTVDNLFISGILLAISSLFGLNVLLELRDRGLPLPLLGKKKREAGTAVAGPGGAKTYVLSSGALRESGVVEHVAYFEAAVGGTNRCIVTLRDGTAPRMLVFKGDVRDQFPVGGRVEVTYRSSEQGNDLLERKLG
ncbi:MAG: hypothetical protein ACR2IF_12545 [Terriglobales bacterium]